MKIELRYIFILLTAFIALLPLSGQKANKKVTIYGMKGANGVIVIDLKGTPDKNNLKK